MAPTGRPSCGCPHSSVSHPLTTSLKHSLHAPCKRCPHPGQSGAQPQVLESRASSSYCLPSRTCRRMRHTKECFRCTHHANRNNYPRNIPFSPGQAHRSMESAVLCQGILQGVSQLLWPTPLPLHPARRAGQRDAVGEGRLAAQQAQRSQPLLRLRSAKRGQGVFGYLILSIQ